MHCYVVMPQSTNEIPVYIWILGSKDVSLNYTIIPLSVIIKGSRQFNLCKSCLNANKADSSTFWKYTAAFSPCTARLWLLMNMCVECGSFRLCCCLMCGIFTGWTSSSICYRCADSLIKPPPLLHRVTTCIHMHACTPAEIKLHSSLSTPKIEIMI